MRDRLVVGGSIQRPFARLDPPLDGSFAEPRLREMMGDDLRLAFGHCLEPIAQDLGNAPMQHLPAALEQVLVGYFHPTIVAGSGLCCNSATAKDFPSSGPILG